MQLFSAMILMISAMMFGKCEATETIWVPDSPGAFDGKQMYVKKFEVEGHTYFYFIDGEAKGLKQVIHDPECQCLKKEKGDKK